MTYENAVLGDFYQDKPSFNLNSVLNYFLSKPVAFPASITIPQEVQFPDVSFYQGEIDYSVMRLQTDTIILRIGQNTWKDEQFERNYLEAKKQGMLVGGYFFYDDRVSPQKQFETILSALQGKKLELEVYIDWENSYGGQFKGLKNVVALMQLVENAGLNIKGVGLYTGYYWLVGNSNPITNASQYNYLKTRPLWLAWYGLASVVKIPAPWSELLLWQWGTPPVDWGQETREIDMNLFNGTREQFESRYKGVDTVSFKITPDTSSGCKIRSDHVTGVSNQIGSLVYGKYGFGTVRWGDGQTEDWIQITQYENPQGGIVSLTGWIASRSGGTKVATITEVVEPPPPTPTLPTINVDLSDPEGNYPPIHIEWKPNEPTN